MEISVKHNIDKLLPKLAAVGSRQTPFVVAMALTKTGKIAQEEIKKAMPRAFDRPTSYTLNSTYLRPATKTRLEALVKIKDENFKGLAANKWLHAEVFGGVRNLKRSERSLKIKGYLKDGEQIVPGKGVSLDGYGNIRGGQMSKILGALQSNADPMQNETTASRKRGRTKRRKAEYFVGSPGGGRLPRGVYARTSFAFGSAIKPVLIFTKAGRYKKRLRFEEIVAQAARDNFEGQLYVAIERALATAR
jgi:hypothetical protein